MKTTKILLGLASAALMSAPAMAQDSNAYAGVSVDAFEFDIYALSGRVGYNFTEFFGVEGQVGVGIIDDSETFAGTEVSTNIDVYGAAFLTGRYPASPSFDVIGRVGYYVAEVSAEAGGFDESASTDDFAFGVGGQYNFGPAYQNGIRLEYTNLQGDGGSGDLFSLGYMRKF